MKYNNKPPAEAQSGRGEESWVYVSSQRVLYLTMGKGGEIPAKETEAFAENSKKSKTYRIACDNFLTRASINYHLKFKTICVTTKNCSLVWGSKKLDIIHPIGMFIMTSRKSFTQGDIYKIPDSSFADLIKRDESKEKREFYYIPTRDILRWFMTL